ncbi:hypothetical protein, partial [Cytobacillus oceanisediminis]|uniref:hypothetical protein n=1 Tax=Cytobacillus oceanisediminis TaxID=665099 RepID=UPI001C92D6DE
EKDWSKLFGGSDIEGGGEVLKTVKLTGNEIDRMILSDVEFEDGGNIDEFGKGEFYVEKEEVDGWVFWL